MASYEIEHSVPQTSTPTPHPRRPDLSTFFSLLTSLNPSPDEPRVRPGAIPVPGDISAAFRSLAEAFEIMRRDHEGGGSGGDDADDDGGDAAPYDTDLITTMITSLLASADTPPSDITGVSETFCDDLERIPKKRLRKDQSCPICNEPFLDDPYPLVVRLPCHREHLFDLECVRPWLRLRGTCPLDRRDFGKEIRERDEERRKEVLRAREKEGQDGEEEAEWDGLYG